MLAVVLWGTSPVLAMEIPVEDFTIQSITPIKKGLLPEQRREAIQSFLLESLKPEYEFDITSIISHQTRTCDRYSFTTCILNDGSEWVENPPGLDRFLGYLYLKKAIEHYDDQKILYAIETRFAYKKPDGDITIRIEPYSNNFFKTLPVLNSYDFCTFSRYLPGKEDVQFQARSLIGGKKEIKAKWTLLSRIRFTDIQSEYDNTKYKNIKRGAQGKICIYDTEYRSFSNAADPYFDESGDQTFTFLFNELKG